MEICKLTLSDWEKYKELRLEALEKDSEAFGDSYEESLKRTDDDWKTRLENPKNHIFAARERDNYIGMAAAYQEKGQKMSHIAYVWGVYVRDTYRGKGIGKKLMEVVISELQANKEIEKINLNVNTKQISAVKLYESFGFQIIGTLHKELKINGEYFDEYVMEKIF